MKAGPTPFDQKLFFVFIVTFASMTAFEFAGQYLFPSPVDWRANLITSLFTSGLAVIIAYFPLKSYYDTNLQLLSEAESRQQVEKELRKSEEKYRLLADNATDIIWILDLPTGRFTYFSPSVEKIQGYPPEEALGLSLEKVFTPESYSRAMAELKKTLEQDRNHLVEHERIRILEFEEYRKDGSIFSTETRMKFIRDAKGIPVQIQGITRDITGRKRVEAELRESEDFNRGLVESMPDMVAVYDHERKIRYVNPAVTRMLGYSMEELEGKDMMDYIVPEDRTDIARVIAERLATGTTRSVEVEILGKEGQRLTVITKGTPVHYHKGPAVLLVLIDITERTTMESAYQAMVRSMVGTTGFNSLQNITKNVSSWLGADCVMVGEIQPDNQTVNVLSMLLDQKPVTDFTYTLRGTPCENVAEKGFCCYPDNVRALFPESKDLVELNIRGYIGTPLRNSEGAVIGVLCALSRRPFQPPASVKEIIDIIAVKAAAEIERTRIERTLRESEEKFRMVVENSLDGILIVDMKGTVLFRNRSVAKIFDVERESFESGTKNVMEFIAPESRSQVLHDFGQVAQGIDSYLVNYQVVTATGRQIWVESIGKRIRFQNSPAILISMRDITARKWAEDALRLANKKLNMLSSITRHDVLNLLTALLAYLTISKEDATDLKMLKYVEKAEQAATAIRSQVEFTRNYQDIGTQEPRWQLLSGVIDNGIRQLKPVGMAIDVGVAGVEIYADALLEKVFYNLMENSLRHGEHVTRLDFSSRETENGLVITYSDDGAGITAKDKKNLFKRGFGKHTGLGLFLSKEILAITGITIAENGEPGQGALFEIMVPKGVFRYTGKDGPDR